MFCVNVVYSPAHAHTALCESQKNTQHCLKPRRPVLPRGGTKGWGWGKRSHGTLRCSKPWADIRETALHSMGHKRGLPYLSSSFRNLPPLFFCQKKKKKVCKKPLRGQAGDERAERLGVLRGVWGEPRNAAGELQVWGPLCVSPQLKVSYSRHTVAKSSHCPRGAGKADS